MTWTYNTADLATSSKDQVRLLMGDTVSTACWASNWGPTTT